MPGTILFGIDVESESDDSLGFARYGGELFGGLRVPVTWYLTGRTLERYPDVFRAVEADGLIELQSHTYAHTLLRTVLMQLPDGLTVHGSTGWYLHSGGSLDEIDADLAKCQDVFESILGRRATALTGPWGYYRGLGDRPDLLEIVRRHGFMALRAFARNEYDCQPVPLEWQPFFYRVQGFPEILECMIHDYQDDFYWNVFARPGPGEHYADHLRRVADMVAEQDLTWSLCSHDHGCATRDGFERKAGWFRAIIERAQSLDIRFLTVGQYYGEMRAQTGNGR